MKRILLFRVTLLLITVFVLYLGYLIYIDQMCDVLSTINLSNSDYGVEQSTIMNPELQIIVGEAGIYTYHVTFPMELCEYKDGNLNHIAYCVNSFVCTDVGIAYSTTDGNLYTYQNGTTQYIADCIGELSWDGTSLVYYSETDDAIYRLAEHGIEPILKGLGMSPSKLLSNSECLVILTEDIYHLYYQYSSMNQKIIRWENAMNASVAILHGNQIITIGNFQNGCEIYNLKSDEISGVALIVGAGERIMDVTAGVLGDKLYYSIDSVIFPRYDTNSDDGKVTGQLNLDTLEVNVINNHYYSLLYRDGKVVWGCSIVFPGVIIEKLTEYQ